MRSVSRVTVTGTQLLCNTWPLNDACPCTNKDISGNGKESTEVARAKIQSKSDIDSQFIGILAKPLNIYYGVIVLQRHRSETNGIAERAVRRVKEGTSAILLKSGLDENWWADSMECDCYLRNVEDLYSDGKTPYERRFGEPFGGPLILFGSMVECHPICAIDQSRL